MSTNVNDGTSPDAPRCAYGVGYLAYLFQPKKKVVRDDGAPDRLAKALGLPFTPTMTPEQERAFDEKMAKADAEADRLYGRLGEVEA